MPSTDMDGSPIIILSVEDAKVAKTAVHMVQALHRLGDVTIHDPDKWEKTAQKLRDFLDKVES